MRHKLPILNRCEVCGRVWQPWNPGCRRYCAACLGCRFRLGAVLIFRPVLDSSRPQTDLTRLRDKRIL